MRRQMNTEHHPLPRRVDVSPERAIEVRLGIVALEAGLARPVSLPGLAAVDEPEFGHDQTYGPMTPWVVTNARAMLGLAGVDLLAAHMELSSHAEPSSVTIAALQMTADRVGRTDAHEQVGALARRVSLRLQERREWREQVTIRSEDLGLSRREARAYLGEHLDIFIGKVLRACALEDVMSLSLRLQALGAWRCASSATEDDPGPEWRCSDRTTATLRAFFGDMDEDDLLSSLRHILAPLDPDEEEVHHRLIGSTLVRAASPPPLAQYVGPGLADVVSYRGGRSFIDQVARLIAALCEPPEWLGPDDLALARERVAGDREISWPS